MGKIKKLKVEDVADIFIFGKKDKFILLNLDSKEPDFTKYEDYLMTENRFANLKRVNKEEADTIIENQKQWAIDRYNYYKKISEE